MEFYRLHPHSFDPLHLVHLHLVHFIPMLRYWSLFHRRFQPLFLSLFQFLFHLAALLLIHILCDARIRSGGLFVVVMLSSTLRRFHFVHCMFLTDGKCIDSRNEVSDVSPS